MSYWAYIILSAEGLIRIRKLFELEYIGVFWVSHNFQAREMMEMPCPFVSGVSTAQISDSVFQHFFKIVSE